MKRRIFSILEDVLDAILKAVRIVLLSFGTGTLTGVVSYAILSFVGVLPRMFVGY